MSTNPPYPDGQQPQGNGWGQWEPYDAGHQTGQFGAQQPSYGQPPGYQQPGDYPYANPYQITPRSDTNESCMGCGMMGCFFAAVLIIPLVIGLVIMLMSFGGMLTAVPQ